MTFAVTAKGFFKDKIMKVLEKGVSFEMVYTDKLREAKQFSSRGKAMKFLTDNELDGFAFNPKEQEPIRDMYNVVKRRVVYVSRDPEPLILEWIPERAIMTSNSDLGFLNGVDNANLYSIDDATKICIERNEGMLLELYEKINKQKQSAELIQKIDDIKQKFDGSHLD